MSDNDTTTDATAATTIRPDDANWLDVVLPALGIGFLILFCIIFFNYLIKFLHHFKSCCCCKRGVEAPQRSSSRGHDNPESVNDDLPPSYSVAGLGRSSVEVFRVIPDDVSDALYLRRAESDISEKLPSYLEIMEEKQLKAANSATSTLEQTEPDSEHPTTVSQNPENPDSDSVSLPHATIETDGNEEDQPENESEPPPYETVST